jgi:hypothetical protein
MEIGLYLHQIRVMQKLLRVTALVMLLACKPKESSKPPAKPASTDAVPSVTVTSHEQYMKKTIAYRLTIAQRWPVMNRFERQKAFTSTVTEIIIPHWIGTPWNFYGTTQTPGRGTIACGYFVTTVLRDAGLNLARTKLAQCASEQMIRTLVQTKYIQQFSNVSMAQFLQAIRQQGYGLYIIGLDSHTGFLYNDDKEIYFIHANYTGTRCVINEKAAGSIVLAASKYKVIGKISADEKVLERWAKY